MEDTHTLAAALKDAMHAAGVGTTQLADALGVSPSTVSHWRTGRSEPTANHVREIAAVLDVPAETLFAAQAGLPVRLPDMPEPPPKWARDVHGLSPATVSAIRLLIEADRKAQADNGG